MADATLEYVDRGLTRHSSADHRTPTHSQAYATRAEFAAQRAGLTGIQARMSGVVGTSRLGLARLPFSRAMADTPCCTAHVPYCSSSPRAQFNRRDDQLAEEKGFGHHGQRDGGLCAADSVVSVRLRGLMQDVHV